MSISLLDNLSIKKKSPNVERDLFNTVADMVAFSENYLPSVFECNVIEDGNRYRYNVSNADLGDGLGKWRLVGSGGSADFMNYYTRTETQTLLESYVEKELGKTLTTNDFTDLDKEQIEINKNKIEVLNGDDTVDGSVSKKVLAVLDESKLYTDQQLLALDQDQAIFVDEKPTFNEDDWTVSYVKDGVAGTTEGAEIWFYYMEDGKLMQTTWIGDQEATIISAGSVNFSDYVHKTNDVVSIYTGDETDTNKVPDIAAMKAMEEKIQVKLDGKISNMQDVSKVGYVPVVGEDGLVTFKGKEALNGTAENVEYLNADYPELTNVDLAIDKILAKIYYVDPSITSFTMTPSTTEYEIGSVVNGLTFAWTVNKDIVGQTLTDCTITVDDRTATYGSDLSATKTFTLTVSDGENNASATKKISFLNKAYWGSAAIPGEYNSAFVLGLSNSKLTSSKASTYNMTVGAGEYGYLAVPTSFGTISSCWIGGFEVTLENCGAISFTNASGHNSSYTIYKTVQAGLGSISMQIK